MAVDFQSFINRAKDLKANNAIAEEYMMILANKENLKENSKRDYSIMVMLFLESLDKDISLLSIDDVDAYKQVLKSHSRINSALPQIGDFINYCKQKGISVNIQKQDIQNLKIPNRDVEKENPPKALTPVQIMKIRQELVRREDLRKLLLFEVLYGFGVKEEELSFFSIDNYNYTDGSFKNKSKNVEYILPKYLQKLINNATEKSFENLKKTTGSNKDRVKKVGKWVGIDLKITDLTETHEKMSIKCFACGDTYPLEAQYWKLKMLGDNDLYSYFPICNYCGEKELSIGAEQ